MIPSVLARHTRTSIEDFLRTTFPISSPFFHGMLDRLLEEEGGVFKGPYLSIQLPFLRGKGGADSFPDVPLKFPPYLHQERAFDRLSGPAPRSTIVATGTGSGKTESFLWPILDHCYRHRAEKGIKAILIYPMNALASDQAGRIARAIATNPKLAGNVTAGLYVGGGGHDPKKGREMTENQVITNRTTQLLTPPDILLTNYKMLDYLLVRPQDSALWKANGPETLRFLVVDELHTFDGAQGTDLACLIRRLKARLETPEKHLCCVGTSATLGSGDDGDRLRDYAREVFDEPFDKGALVTEERQSAGEFLGDSLISRIDLPPPEKAGELDPASYDAHLDYIRAQAELWLGMKLADDEIEDDGWRLALGEELKSHLFFQNLLRALGGRPMEVGELLKKLPGLREADREYAEALLASLVTLISEARVAVAGGGSAPFLNVRFQLWLRELRRMVGEVSATPRLRFSDDLNASQAEHHLPVVHCRECGATGWGAVKKQNESTLQTDLQSFYVHFFSHSQHVVFLFPETERSDAQQPDGVKPSLLCPSCLHLTSKLDDGPCRECGHEERIYLLNTNPRKKRRERWGGSRDCPYCKSQDSLTVLGSRAASLTSVMVTQLFASSYNDDKKLLTFSDSVQDAAHRAGFFKARTYRFNLRAAIQQFVQAEGHGLRLSEVHDRFCDFWRARMPDEATFVATFLAPDMEWYRDYEELRKTGALPAGGRLEGKGHLKRRLGWEILSEYGFNCRIGRTLEKTSSSTIKVTEERLHEVEESLLEPLQNKIGALRDVTKTDLRRFLLGLIAHLKNMGGVVAPVLESYIESEGTRYLLNRRDWMPSFSHRAPVFLSARGGQRFERVLAEQRTWSEAWAEKCFDHLDVTISSELDELYRLVIKALCDAKILEERKTRRGSEVWGLDRRSLVVDREVQQLRCERCGHNVSVAASEKAIWEGGPCLRFGCEGRYRLEARRRDYYGQLYATGDVERVFTAEHTGLIGQEEREELEREFKAPLEERRPWYPNLLSCTPTMELGIDIGDLSSLILCSMPPAQANYLQRIGRTGRRDGNSLNLAVANARPHDLFFFADPKEMIDGRVEPPGVFLEASAVLERQLTAYCFDRWVGSGVPAEAVPPKLTKVLNNLQPVDASKFPHNLLRFIDSNRTAIFEDFLGAFDIRDDSPLAGQLREYLEGGVEVEGSLTYRLVNAFHRRQKQRLEVNKKTKALADSIRKLQALDVKDKVVREELEDLKKEKEALQGLHKGLGSGNVFNFLTDEGLLPNYAFPEAGVTLHSIIWRKTEDHEADGSRYESWSYSYVRPAASAIAELAPANSFYASGRKVTVDQVDMITSEFETWRFCRSCSFSAPITDERTALASCPRCGDTMWGDEGQKHQMLRMRQVVATTQDRRSRIADDSDDREPNFYNKQMLVDAEDTDIDQAYRIDSEELPFGFEFLKRATFREINFGEKTDQGTSMKVANVSLPRKGFTICSQCGKVQDDPKKPSHAFNCKVREGDSALTDCVFLYRELRSEAIRILLPIDTFAGSDRKLHSFIAALHLGLKRRFRGNIDHLQSAVQDEPEPGTGYRRQYLVLYDTVPGGTGYLKQLMISGDELMKVFDHALEVMSACSCGRDPDRDGCYRCLYAYRHSYDMKQTSRKAALNLFGDILAHRDKLKPIKNLKEVSINALFDSKLEANLVEALRRAGTPEAPVKVIPIVFKGKPGFFLKIGDRAYNIEQQAKLGEDEGVKVPSKVDFLIHPAKSEPDVLPIALFTDGFDPHKDQIGWDTAQRLALLRSGRYLVWTLTWNDVESRFKDQGSFFKDELDLADKPAGGTYAQCAEHYGAGELKVASKESSFEWLIRQLVAPDSEETLRRWRKWAFVHGLMLLSPQELSSSKARDRWLAGLRGCFPPSLAGDLSGGDSSILGSRERHGSKEARLLRTFASIEQAAVASGDVNGMRIGLFLDDTEEAREHSGFRAIWNGFWRLTNLFQFLPRASFVTRTGVDEGRYDEIPPPVLVELSTSEAPPATDAWAEIKEYVDDELFDLLDQLAAAGWPLPAIPPFELTNKRNETIAEAELGWPELKIAFADPDQMETAYILEKRGWKVVPLEQVMENPADYLALAGGK